MSEATGGNVPDDSLDGPPLASRPAFEVILHGTGEVEVAAYGIADAEATVEKELRRTLPGVSVRVREVRRDPALSRIVETFEVSFSLRYRLDVEDEPDREAVRRRALRAGRAALEGTRFEKVIWDRTEVTRR